MPQRLAQLGHPNFMSGTSEEPRETASKTLTPFGGFCVW